MVLLSSAYAEWKVVGTKDGIVIYNPKDGEVWISNDGSFFRQKEFRITYEKTVKNAKKASIAKKKRK